MTDEIARIATLLALILLAASMAVFKTRWQTANTKPLLDKKQSLYFEGAVFFVLLWVVFYSFTRAPLLSVVSLVILGFHANQLASGKRFEGGGLQDWVTLAMHLLLLAYAVRFEPLAVPVFVIASLLHVWSLIAKRPLEASLKMTVK